jgi:hypothetical protein
LAAKATIRTDRGLRICSNSVVERPRVLVGDIRLVVNAIRVGPAEGHGEAVADRFGAGQRSGQAEDAEIDEDLPAVHVATVRLLSAVGSELDLAPYTGCTIAGSRHLPCRQAM